MRRRGEKASRVSLPSRRYFESLQHDRGLAEPGSDPYENKQAGTGGNLLSQPAIDRESRGIAEEEVKLQIGRELDIAWQLIL
jgi:hypothetical protein